MSVRVSILYGVEGKRFDLDYFVEHHAALTERLMRPFGLRGIEINRGLGGGAPGEAAPYGIVAHMVFDTIEEFQRGFAASGEEIEADVPNYTDAVPQLQISSIVASTS